MIEKKFNYQPERFLRDFSVVPVNLIPKDLRFILTHLLWLKSVGVHWLEPNSNGYSSYFSNITPEEFKRYIDKLKIEPHAKTIIHGVYDEMLDEFPNYNLSKFRFSSNNCLLKTLDFSRIKDSFIRELLFDWVANLTIYAKGSGSIFDSNRFNITSSTSGDNTSFNLNINCKFTPTSADLQLFRKNKVKDIFTKLNPFGSVLAIFDDTKVTLNQTSVVKAKKVLNISFNLSYNANADLNVAFDYFYNLGDLATIFTINLTTG